MNYLEILMNCFPDAQVYTRGDPNIYEDLIWITPVISKATIDASVCAQGGYNPQVIGQSLNAWYGTIPAMSGTTKFAAASSRPLVTEGTEIWNKSIIMRDAAHKIKITTSIITDSSRSNTIAVAIFRGNTCICTTDVYSSGSTKPQPIPIVMVDDAIAPAVRTYSCRVGIIGSSSTGTWYVNRLSSGDTFNNTTTQQCFIIEELE